MTLAELFLIYVRVKQWRLRREISRIQNNLVWLHREAEDLEQLIHRVEQRRTEVQVDD